MKKRMRQNLNLGRAIVALSLLTLFVLGCKRLTPMIRDNVNQPKIISSAGWGGVLPSGSFRAQTPEFITVLHSGNIPAPGTDMREYMKAMQQRDLKNGYGDLGAHFYIDPQGNIYQSRRIVLQGRIAHEILMDTSGHVFVMLLGDYNTQPLSEPLRQQFIALVGWLCQHHQIPLENLKGLNAYVETDSPGRLASEWLESPQFNARFKEYLGIPVLEPMPTPVQTPLAPTRLQ